ncbi:hypothetical protein LDZ44_05455 [Bacteroides xylanisolvens]|uniref:hypothetical protein n=1 Tax=Bacteroides xylanisolvens TaxID=371601 RepID=UPI001CDBF9FA|nr:hypothetical protein [Bacteroides xylanisolvens]MCA4464653.1 hypothetical protein [Bacteroides xylanisolvens]MCA4469127.1 hypothetical protein [Bacteroides xylanisolvens]MCA4478391.1 hypothetical protein [Bacteroides xylanisolvens]MCA4487632.1 hypothetical protein [Bacteroides xylanisolvens]MCA4491892.1 hypothetical protein [Bacteroides xylanisolvens]
MSKKNKSLKDLMASKDQLQSVVSESVPQDELAEQTSESEPMKLPETTPSEIESTRLLETTLSDGESTRSLEPTLSQDPSNFDAMFSEVVNLGGTVRDAKEVLSKESIKKIALEGIHNAMIEYQTKAVEEEKARQEKLRAEGKPATPLEILTKCLENRNAEAQIYSKNVKVANNRYSFLIGILEELCRKVIHKPIDPPKKPTSWQELKHAFIAYPWYYIKCFYFSWHVRHSLKIMAWSTWCVSIGLLLFVIHANMELEKTKEQYRMVKYYYLTDEKVHKVFLYVEGLYADPDANVGEINAMIQTINKKNQPNRK